MEGRAVCRFTEGPVGPDWALAQVQGPDAGCVHVFLGTVRVTGVEGEVTSLHYRAYDGMAEAEFARIAAEVLDGHAVLRLAMEHSLGTVPLGGCSIAVAIAAAHRKEVFAAGALFMDELKARLPLWKEEVYADGRRWIGQGS
jgi:molybdopterin synthase catalytic subunit